MKKKELFFCSFLLAAVSLIYSCSKSVKHDLNINNDIQPVFTTSSGPDFLTPAPAGFKWVIHYEFEDFNFHRPKFDCLNGFWFCFQGGYWRWELVPATSSTTSPGIIASISGDTAFLWAQPIDSSTVELHFPIALQSISGYSSTDLSTLNVDDTMYISDNAILALGDYPVTETNDELVIQVPVIIID